MPKINEAGLKLLQSFESLRLKAYKPVEGEEHWTIGWGHYGPDVKPGMVITREKADELLRQDIAEAEQAVANLVKVQLTPNEFAALVSLVYNIGAGAFEDSTVLRKINQKDFYGAADAFRLFNKGGDPLRVLEGLTRRREDERTLFLTPSPGAAQRPSGAPLPADYLLVSPAENSKRTRWIPKLVVDVLAWIAEGLGPKFPFRIDEAARKVYFGRVSEPRSPAAPKTAAAPPDTPSVKGMMKPGDIHILADRKSRSSMAYDHAGKPLWLNAEKEPQRVPVRLEGVEGGTLENPIWDKQNSDTPPGLWEAYRVEKIPSNDPAAASYGWYYIYMRPIGGPAKAIGDVGIGAHGGGIAAPNPWAAFQGWYDTQGCLRYQNQDLEDHVVPVVNKALKAGHRVLITTK